MKKQLKIKLTLNKETVAKLNEEQMELVVGGQAAGADATVVIDIGFETDTGKCGGSTGPSCPINSKTCPPTSTCCCSV